MMMVVDDIDIIAPRKMLSIVVQPTALPTAKPRVNIPMHRQTATIMALLPTFISFLKLNSSPRAKSRKMIPISDHYSTVAVPVTFGKSPT